jgi:hypothetical protein
MTYSTDPPTAGRKSSGRRLISGLERLLKGTVSRDFFTVVFFIKHLLLVLLDTPKKDFEFFRIFEELFEFVIDSSVYSSPGS